MDSTERYFEIERDGKPFSFSLDPQGYVWLTEEKNGKAKQGQERPVRSLEEAKETAELMLYAMGRIKRS